jgi:cytochrome c-type biogenesis protein CcmF
LVPILGRVLILLALLAAAAGAVVALATGVRPTTAGWTWSRRLAYAFAAFMALANATMEYALLSHDFSVSYVAHVGSRSVPT